jgi:hypothetical protein
MQQRRGTAAEWTSANAVLGAGEIGFETDTDKFKIGNGSTNWENLPYFINADDIETGLLDTDEVSEGENNLYFTNERVIDLLTGSSQQNISITEYDGQLIIAAENGVDDSTTDQLGEGSTNKYFTEERAIEAVGLSADITTANLNDTLLYNDITEKWENSPGIPLDENGHIDLTFLSNLINGAGEDWGTLKDIEDYVTENYALLTDLPVIEIKSTTDWSSDTSVRPAGSLNIELGEAENRIKIGDGVATFANLDYVPSIDSVATQISTAISTKANLDSPTFTGNVSLPSTTAIGDVSSTEIGYLDGVTSAIQTQINAKLDSTTASSTYAPINNPTFTGTVAGISATMVGLGNVDNSSDADKPISTATQTALDGKLSLSGGTMTGKITLDSNPTQALHAVTKQYVDSVEAGLITRPQVKAATTENLNATYANGTSGVGATLTADSNGAFPLIDGVQLSTANGDRGLLVKNQTNAAENGRYNLTTLGDENTPWVLTRCGLCDQASEIPGSYVFVTDGTSNGQTGWVQHVDDSSTFTVGTDDIDVYQFSGAGTLVAGTNISVNGYEVSVIDAPVFSGMVDASASGVEFSDGVQTKAGVPSLTAFVEKTASYTLDTLDHQDNIVEMNSASALTFTIPTNETLAWPVGASMDIFQTGAGEVTIAPASGVTLNGTPGFKLRTQWSSATILKRGTNSWVVYGDLKS